MQRVCGLKLCVRAFVFFVLFHWRWNNPAIILRVKNAPSWLKHILKQDMWCSSGIPHKRVLGDLPSERPWCTLTLKRCVWNKNWCPMICNVYDMHNFFFCTLSLYVILHVRKHLFVAYSTIKKKLSRIHRCRLGSQAKSQKSKVTPSGERTELQVINSKVVQFSPVIFFFDYSSGEVLCRMTEQNVKEVKIWKALMDDHRQPGWTWLWIQKQTAGTG